MEKRPIPQADRLVGHANLSPEQTKKLLGKLPLNEKGEPIKDARKILTKAFNEVAPDKKEFKDFELQKTERDLYIIHMATEAVKKFARELGREDFVDLPTDNIHLLKKGGTLKYTKDSFDMGSHSTVLGQVFVDKKVTDLQTAITTFHELWHALGSHEAIQVTTKNKIDWYRAGFSIKSRDGKEEYFYRIDEALTGLMTKRFVEEILAADPSFKDEIEKIETRGKEINTTRQGEVQMLHNVAENIYKRNQDVFASPKDVVTLFLKGQVTGNIMPIARIIENTFGKGSFRKFGEITQE